jgi:serine protease
VNVGTSFAAPIVSGIVALMAGANGNLGAAQLRARLREGATTPFPQSADPMVPMCHVPTGPNDVQVRECNCTTSTCGAGMANADGALAAALRPIAALSAPATVAPGQTVNLSGAGSAGACNRTIASYFWQVVGGTGILTGPNNTPTTSVNAPVTGSFTVRLTVTDDVGEQDSADIAIASTSTSTSAPANAGDNACPVDLSPPPITIGVSPTTVTLEAVNGTQLFAATVTNATNNQGVTWQVDGVAGGNATVGTITSGGSYTAPAAVPSPATVTVTATSIEDPTKAATAQVTIAAPPPRPGPGASGGGGGAGLDLLLLVCALTVLAFCSGRLRPSEPSRDTRGRAAPRSSRSRK